MKNRRLKRFSEIRIATMRSCKWGKKKKKKKKNREKETGKSVRLDWAPLHMAPPD